MSKASGLVLIALGIGTAVYAMPYHTDAADEPTTSAQTQLVPNIVETAQKADEIIPPVPKPAVRPAKVEAKAEIKTAAGPDTNRTTVVTVAQLGAAPITSVGAGLRSAAILPGDKAGIARELQRELRRVGCYDGEVNGSWTPLSRRAMKAFTDRVNASLPVDQPDYILLTLVQGRQEKACGAPCPEGQAMSGAGRCLPNAVLAITKKVAPAPSMVAARKGGPVEKPTASADWSTTTSGVTTIVTEADPSTLTEGRMGLAGPKKAGSAALTLPEGDAARLAAVTADPADGAKAAKDLYGPDQDRAASKGPTDYRPKSARDKKPELYSAASRRKFGTWFFRQQDAWNN